MLLAFVLAWGDVGKNLLEFFDQAERDLLLEASAATWHATCWAEYRLYCSRDSQNAVHGFSLHLRECVSPDSDTEPEPDEEPLLQRERSLNFIIY